MLDAEGPRGLTAWDVSPLFWVVGGDGGGGAWAVVVVESSDEMFKIPRNCYKNLFVENVKSTYSVQHLPLAERLGGWKIEKRQRPSLEIYDKYFYHNQSGKMFRTFREVARFIKDASLPRKAPERNNAQSQGLMALEASGSEPLEAASFEETDRKVNNSAFFPLLRVAESLERDRKRRRGENLQHHDKQKETGKGKEKEKEKEKGSSSSEEVTPHLTPERGSECLRRFNNEECNMSQDQSLDSLLILCRSPSPQQINHRYGSHLVFSNPPKMDRSWMLKDRRSKDYEDGVEQFLNFAVIHARDLQSIRCPCRVCGNMRTQGVEEIRNHLFFSGIDQSYQKWIWHGEAATRKAPPFANANANAEDIFHQEADSPPSNDVAETIEMVEAAYNHYTADPKEFKKLLEDAEKPLYHGSNFTKLSALVKLFNYKARN
ncbi:hypothetical protein Vadar_000041 [Vaccinium darrowii]|uniref:Uncharacterized protein n=1 Tax=Vaccinium darrowii TaxID=229202 RepID=A0ACB7ZHI7_9ERIC|nr:hypothetical protein Vadar_000041 [Vaccinium darrowii]